MTGLKITIHLASFEAKETLARLLCKNSPKLAMQPRLLRKDGGQSEGKLVRLAIVLANYSQSATMCCLVSRLGELLR